MPTFQVQEAFGGNAITFSPNYPSVEIAFNASGFKQHGDGFVLTAPLASKREIDEAIGNLIAGLETARAVAIQKLQGYQQRAQPK